MWAAYGPVLGAALTTTTQGRHDGHGQAATSSPARAGRGSTRRLEDTGVVRSHPFCRPKRTWSPAPSPEPDHKSSERHRHQNIERRLADQVAKVTECVAVSAIQPAEVVVSVGHGTGGVTGNLGDAWGSWVGTPLAAGDWPGRSMSST